MQINKIASGGHQFAEFDNFVLFFAKCYFVTHFWFLIQVLNTPQITTSGDYDAQFVRIQVSSPVVGDRRLESGEAQSLISQNNCELFLEGYLD